MDIMNAEQRRRNMQNIKSKDTSIENLLRKALWHKGYRYRKHYNRLPGKPDIVLPKYQIVIFCDSEFFHGKDWSDKKERLLLAERSEYWISKIEKNMQRDLMIDQQLKSMGWTVIHFWGIDIKRNTDQCVNVIEEIIFEQKIDAEMLDMEVWDGDL